MPEKQRGSGHHNSLQFAIGGKREFFDATGEHRHNPVVADGERDLVHARQSVEEFLNVRFGEVLAGLPTAAIRARPRGEAASPLTWKPASASA